jgi:hypothetical protein
MSETVYFDVFGVSLQNLPRLGWIGEWPILIFNSCIEPQDGRLGLGLGLVLFSWPPIFHQGAGITQSVQLLATGWTTKESEFESRYGQELSLLHVVQTGSGVHPASYTMDVGTFSPGVMRQGSETDHSPPASPEVKKMWLYTSPSPYAYMG